MAQINWLEFEDGMSKAKASDKLALVDFFSPT